MSYTSLHIVYKTTAPCVLQLGNSWLSAPPLWTYLWGEYIERGKSYPHTEKELQPLWDLVNNIRVPIYLKAALAATFDYVIIKPKNLRTIAKELRAAHNVLQSVVKPYQLESGVWVNGQTLHWAAIADELWRYKQIGLNKRALGIGISCTSTNNLWNQYTATKGKLFSPVNIMEVIKIRQ